MSKYEFVLRNDEKDRQGVTIGKFDAYFSEIDKNNTPVIQSEIPGYVEIEGAVFKTRFWGGNYSIFVAPGVLKDSPKKEPRVVAYTAVTENKFFWYKVWHDKSQKFTFWGLILAVVGALIDTSFAIGKIHVFFPISDSVSILLLALAFGLKALGLWWVFKKGFREAK